MVTLFNIPDFEYNLYQNSCILDNDSAKDGKKGENSDIRASIINS